MSSTERAPEPTMDDILASIRRIITDDETGKSPADKSAAVVRTEEEGLEGEADNQIIDNIARVLSSGGEPPANEDEEIMDLTGELGGLELVEDEPEPLVQTAEIADVTPEFVDAPDDADDLLELDAEPDVIEPDVLEADLEVIETLEVEETLEVTEFVEPVEVPPPLEATPEPAMPPMTPPPLPEPMPEPAPAAVAEAAPEAPKLSASEEAATALERAIAALKAGQAPTAGTAPVAAATTVAATAAAAAPAFGTPAPEPAATSPEPEAMASEPPSGVIPIPGELPMAVPMESPTPDPETHLDPDADSVLEMAGAEDVPEPLMEADTALDLTETETLDTMILEEAVLEEMAVPDAEAPVAEPVPGFITTPSEVVSAAVMAGTNGLAAHEAPASGAQGVETLGSETPMSELPMSESPVSESPASKSLEDSIKEMLRPMLREWLNENMPRMIREELDSDAVQRGQD